MANNNVPGRNERWKDRIKTSMLINRLKDHANGKIDLSSTQVRSIEILLRKLVPDLKSVKHEGEMSVKNVVIQEYREGGVAEVDGTNDNPTV